MSPPGTPPSPDDRALPADDRVLSDADRVPAILVGHADFARSLLTVAGVIAGPVDDIPCLSNDGRSPDELTNDIRAELERLGLPLLLLVDVANGSCFAAARRAARGKIGAHVLTGVNLPLLLTFLQCRDRFGSSVARPPAVSDRRWRAGRGGAPPPGPGRRSGRRSG